MKISRISRKEAYADLNEESFRSTFQNDISKVRAGDLVEFHGNQVLVLGEPQHERFIGALVEIWKDGQRMHVPLGLLKTIEQ